LSLRGRPHSRAARAPHGDELQLLNRSAEGRSAELFLELTPGWLTHTVFSQTQGEGMALARSAAAHALLLIDASVNG
jgi:hypothetical protein